MNYFAYLFVLSILKKNLCWYLDFHSGNNLFSFIRARLLSISLGFIEVFGGGRGCNGKWWRYEKGRWKVCFGFRWASFLGFFGEFFRSLQSDPPAVICYVSDKLKFNQRFFFQRIHFLNQNLMLARLGKACIFVIFFGIYTHWPVG